MYLLLEEERIDKIHLPSIVRALTDERTRTPSLCAVVQNVLWAKETGRRHSTELVKLEDLVVFFVAFAGQSIHPAVHEVESLVLPLSYPLPLLRRNTRPH